MATINVSNASQLSAALSSASGGDIIVLADGYYGDVTLSQNFASEVTVTSASPLGATFGQVLINGSNVTLDGLTVTGRFTIRDAAHIEVTNSQLNSWNEALFSTDVTFSNNNVRSTVNLEKVDGFAITDNVIGTSPGGVNGDLIRVIGDSKNGVIENNDLTDVAPTKNPDGTYTHADGIQFINRGADWPSDIVIRGNLIFDDPATGDTGNLWMQAIAVGGTDILIENNLVMTGSPNAIIVANSSGGIEVFNNTVLPWPDGGGGTIRVTSTTSGVVVEGNVTNGILNEGGASLSNNFIYSTNMFSEDYWGDLFQLQTYGMAWEDYLPVNGSPIDFGSGYGALERLEELLNGGPVDTPDPYSNPDLQPEPTPAPDPVIITDPDTATVLGLAGSHDISRAGDVIEIAHDPSLALATGTVALSFNADTVAGQQGLLSKDAKFFGNGGHFTAYIDNGKLVVRLQDDASSQVFEVGGIRANVEYDLQVSFGDGQVTAMLNGEVFGEAAFDSSWETNTEFLQIGANGWASKPGDDGFVQVFDGTISDVVITDGTSSYEEIQTLQAELTNPEPDPVPAEQEPKSNSPALSSQVAHNINWFEYITTYDDPMAAFGANSDAGAMHFINHGWREDRANDTFDAQQYLENYSDLSAAVGSDLEASTVHYIPAGFFDGRTDEIVFG